MSGTKFKIYLLVLWLVVIYAPKAKADNASGTPFSFTLGSQSFPVSQDDLNSWVGPQTIAPSNTFNPPPESLENSLLNAIGQPTSPSQNFQTYGYRMAPIYAFVQNVAAQIDKPETEPVLTITNGRATTFSAPQTGTQVDVYKTVLDALNALQTGGSNATITAYSIFPDKSLAQTNSLGINSLIGEGVSKFNGSPHNRRVNIAAGISKFQGIILPQGATFSFDDDLGPVTADAGFLPELVIDDGNTLPELGGGLCQVSTTTFRAAMAAGLPYYRPPQPRLRRRVLQPPRHGRDYLPGSADLKFVNNTPGAIMIWPYEKDSNTLVFDFYGTDDGRKTVLEKPVVYDRQTDGAMKATWSRVITSADGKTSTSTFYSNYQPPALFHKTETYVSTTGTQISATR